jgi:hypothetical protein
MTLDRRQRIWRRLRKKEKGWTRKNKQETEGKGRREVKKERKRQVQHKLPVFSPESAMKHVLNTKFLSINYKPVVGFECFWVN